MPLTSRTRATRTERQGTLAPPDKHVRPSWGVLGTGHRRIATRTVANTGALNGRSAEQVPRHKTGKPRGRADRCKRMEPATAHDQTTTHAPARTLGQPAPADDHEPEGHMEATSASTAKPRQARVCQTNHQNAPPLARQRTSPPNVASPHADGTRPLNPGGGGTGASTSARRDGTRGGVDRSPHFHTNSPTGHAHSQWKATDVTSTNPAPQQMPTPHADGTRPFNPVGRGSVRFNFDTKGRQESGY